MPISNRKPQKSRPREKVREMNKAIPLTGAVGSTPGERPANWLGCMAGTVRITGDIVGPTGSEDDWEAVR
ncbi:MAG: hypothetical protein ACRD20_19645 [Terriglobales bacterium]